MDAKNSANMFKHLEKQSEVLMESYRAMSHELHRLQVEEEMLMQKLYEVMSAEGLLKKKDKQKDSRHVDMKEKDKDSDDEENLSSEEEFSAAPGL
ncbi:uncharacterized protein LOC109820578 isoform X2 [Asparagus officinalis]|uniref:uncharacterized protein LOC109820578 isoform X2 n=1 Tax=Asparagus officinalis TaxID=4686 RepID=UPI00098E4228|nr:uncharacterized protein LOC109820578 isoform X2 [Asparagus officinalis]